MWKNYPQMALKIMSFSKPQQAYAFAQGTYLKDKEQIA